MTDHEDGRCIEGLLEVLGQAVQVVVRLVQALVAVAECSAVALRRRCLRADTCVARIGN